MELLEGLVDPVTATRPSETIMPAVQEASG